MTKILIIKLGALGDVVRTLPVLKAIKQKYPDSTINWITKPNAKDIVDSSPYVDKTITTDEIKNQEHTEKYNLLYNFDIDEEATSLAQEIKSDIKKGFCSDEGFASAFNFPAEYYLNTLFDDKLKKQNKKTYQQMMFDAAELVYEKQHHPIHLSKENIKYAESYFNENNIPKKNLLGIHMGAGSRWASKKWHKHMLVDFIKKAHREGYNILLFGGPNEKQEHEKIYEELKKQGIKIYINNPSGTIKQFASLVNLCNIMICSDSLALHISLSLNKPTIALFFCTSPHEVEDYGLLKKIISPKLYKYFPEKMDQYSEELVKSISPEDVLNKIKQIENETSS